MALSVARHYGRGLYLAQKIVTWERQWLEHEEIEEGRQGCFAKTRSWFDDEGVQLAVRDWISGAGDKITAYGLAKAVGDYLDSRRAVNFVEESISQDPKGSSRVRARTARRWLHKLGLQYTKVHKNVFIDGHERKDVVDYRQNVFIPRWKELQRRMVVFKEDGTWELPTGK